MSAFDIKAYGPVFKSLLEPRNNIMALDSGIENSSARLGLENLDLDKAFSPDIIIDRRMAEGCRSGLWLFHDFLTISHTISQTIETPTGSYWHGIMHRREPDYPNGKYWFDRVGEHAIYQVLKDEAAAIATGTENLPDEAAFLTTQTRWDPFAFIDLCEVSLSSKLPVANVCLSIQQREWELLFEYSYRNAIS